MKTCIHCDCVVVWDETATKFDDIPCPLCDAEKTIKRLTIDNDLMEKRIDDLEEREV